MSKHLLLCAALCLTATTVTYAQNTYPWPVSGNVGIGTTSPGEGTRLQVVGRGLFTGGSFDPGDGTPAGVGVSFDGSAGHIETVQTGIASMPLEIQHYGSVGIGTASPRAKLEVVSNSAGGGVLMALFGSPAAPRIMFYDELDATQGPKVYSNAGYPFIIGGAGNIVLQPAGNVGIGTTSPTEKLSVNGRIRAKEVIVETTGWSDFVFADDYQLQSLAEVEVQIKTNKHLPGVPTAQEVAEKGVSVGDMQALLLAKIEELTLHQIAQEKAIQSLHGKVQSLEAENAALKIQAK